MTQGGGGVIQKMTDDNDSSFRRNGVQYILIKSIDLLRNLYNMAVATPRLGTHLNVKILIF